MADDKTITPESAEKPLSGGDQVPLKVEDSSTTTEEQPPKVEEPPPKAPQDVTATSDSTSSIEAETTVPVKKVGASDDSNKVLSKDDAKLISIAKTNKEKADLAQAAKDGKAVINGNFFHDEGGTTGDHPNEDCVILEPPKDILDSTITENVVTGGGVFNPDEDDEGPKPGDDEDPDAPTPTFPDPDDGDPDEDGGGGGTDEDKTALLRYGMVALVAVSFAVVGIVLARRRKLL